LEPTPEAYVAHIVEVFRAVRRVLRKDATCWINIGDSYNAYNGNRGTESQYAGNRNIMEPSFPTGHGKMAAGLKPKDLIGIPWMVAFALRADGWWLRQDIIWAKPNPMPESVTDRCTKAHEYLFLLSKSARYYYDAASIRETATDTGRENGRDGREEDERARPPGSRARTLARLDYTESGRNKRDVWTIPTAPFPESHFATYPPALVTPCILAGSREGDTVLDPFLGSGTTAMVAKKLGRGAIGIDASAEYLEMAVRRCAQMGLTVEVLECP
jgi:DNA modification methylase